MKYSVFSLSLPECAPSEAAKLIKEAGYDGVEWRCAEQPEPLAPIPNFWKSNRTTLDTKKWKNLVPEYRKIMGDYALECPSLGSYCRADQPDAIKMVIEIAKALDCPRFRIVLPPYDEKTTYQEIYKKMKLCYAHAAELCKDAGVQGLLELHMWNITASASLGHRLIEGLDPRHMGIIYDPGNMVVEGYENWKIGCELLGPYLAFCHAKNSRFRAAGALPSGAVHWAYEPCEMHTGFVDWIAVFKALKSVKYNGWISNEDHFVSPNSSLERIRSGLEHLKQCEALAV